MSSFNKSPIQWVSEAVPPRVKRQGREDDIVFLDVKPRGLDVHQYFGGAYCRHFQDEIFNNSVSASKETSSITFSRDVSQESSENALRTGHSPYELK
jgi:hypothetical protein